VNTNVALQKYNNKRWLIFFAWLSFLYASDLSDIVFSVILGQVPQWLFYCKAGFLVLFFGFCFLWQKIRPLRPYAFVMPNFTLSNNRTLGNQEKVIFILVYNFNFTNNKHCSVLLKCHKKQNMQYLSLQILV